MKEWTTDHQVWYRDVYLKSDHWLSLRTRKLRANPNCQHCGTHSNLDVHHVNYRNIFDVDLSDLLSLCRKCHELEHERIGPSVRNRRHYRRNWIPPEIQEAMKSTKKHFELKQIVGKEKAKLKRSKMIELKYKRYGKAEKLRESLPPVEVLGFSAPCSL